MTTHAPTLDALLTSMGAAGTRLNEIGACEAGAGNISVSLKDPIALDRYFPVSEAITLPWVVPALAGYTVLVTGSGCRLREIASNPVANVAGVVVDEGGKTATLHRGEHGNFLKPTSEFNSHLGVHEDQVVRSGASFQAVVHAQPPQIVAMSHLAAYQDTAAFSRAILRWEPETIVQLPDGIGFLPFMVPGSKELMENNIESLRHHAINVWAKHGIMARSEISALHAIDKVEYAETGAMYERMNLITGGTSQGLSDAEIFSVVKAFGIASTLYPLS